MGKIRTDFVTNSSSSSFIICKNDVSYEKLVEILLEIANKEHALLWEEDEYEFNDEDIENNCVAYRYHITEASQDNPYTTCGWDWNDGDTYDNHYIIDNESCARYYWDVIEDVLDKYNIPWQYGDCD